MGGALYHTTDVMTFNILYSKRTYCGVCIHFSLKRNSRTHIISCVVTTNVVITCFVEGMCATLCFVSACNNVILARKNMLLLDICVTFLMGGGLTYVIGGL